MSRALALLVLALVGGGACVGATARRPDRATRDYPAGVVSLRWRTTVHEHGLFEPRPEECATGAVAKGKLVIGSRAGEVVALDLADGRRLWATKVSGGVDAHARYDDRLGQVYVGTDDGHVYALDAATGAVRWSHKGRGSIERAPEPGGDAIYVSTAADRLVALDARTGEVRWQHDREAPEGFTIHGYSGPRLHRGIVYAGFSDGYIVALNAGTGDAVWGRSLASASEQYVDADATPTVYDEDTLIASSYSGGLYALSASTGDIRWRLGVEGAGTAHVHDGRIFFAAPRDGLNALTGKGEVLWRQGLADAGDLTQPRSVGPYLVFTGSRAGLFVVDRASGRLLEVFNPGRGMCGAPTLGPDGRTLYTLANSGTVYAVEILH